MTTAEATMTMLNRLSEPDLLSVQNHIKVLRKSKRTTVMDAPASEKEFLKGIKLSIKQSKQGKTMSREVARERARAKYGI